MDFISCSSLFLMTLKKFCSQTTFAVRLFVNMNSKNITIKCNFMIVFIYFVLKTFMLFVLIISLITCEIANQSCTYICNQDISTVNNVVGTVGEIV